MNQPKTALVETADELVARWQSLIDLLAFHAKVPCAMINRAEPAERTLVFHTVNGNGSHGYTAGQSIDLGLNSYCANVLKRREPLLIEDARLHSEMADNPTACLGMIFYYGLPIRRANGELFGTLCILDSEPRTPDSQVTGLMAVFRTTLENDLALVEHNRELGKALEREQTANHALSRANDQLAATNQTLDAFAYSISHDLRAPLRRIARFAELLREGEAGGMSTEGQTLLGRINDNADALDELVGNMLEFAHGSSRSLERQPVDMGELAQLTSRELAEDYPGCGFRIAALPGCEGDAAMLKQVWHNLMGNAAKYSSKQPSPCVQVYAEPWHGHQSYVVKDNGVGFDPERATELFQPFKRLHEETDFQGKGIGLAFVQRIVQRHGGDIIAESHPGQGAIFRFWLA